MGRVEDRSVLVVVDGEDQFRMLGEVRASIVRFGLDTESLSKNGGGDS
jgi:hypothetical protein